MSFLPLLAVIGGVVQGVGALATASAQKSAAEFNEAVDKRNASLALSEGQAEAEEQQRTNEQNLGRIRAEYGASGIEFGGDALGVYQDSATQANFDLAKVRYNAQVKSIGFDDQATLDDMNAKSASTAGILGFVGGVVGGGTAALRAS